MSSHFTPEIPLGSKLGAAFIGNLVAAVFYGITCVQTYMFFRNNDRDRQWFKGVIFFLWILDTLHLAIVAHALYYYLIINFGNLAALVSPSWSVVAQVYVTCINDVIVRCIFGRRVWLIAGRSYIVAFCIGTASILTFASGFAFSSLVFGKTFASFSKISYLLYMALGSGVVADLFIASSLCLNLWRQRTSFNKTNSIVRILMVYTINTSLLTTICSATCFITYTIWPDEFTFIGIYFSLMFLNSLLATLNSRDALSEKLGGINTFSGLTFSTNESRSPLSTKQGPSVVVSITREVDGNSNYEMKEGVQKATSSIA